jgi:hypothetical protein
VTVVTPPFNKPSQRIVLRCPFCFVPQQLFDLFMVRDKKGAIQKDKSARLTCALLYAGRANR